MNFPRIIFLITSFLCWPILMQGQTISKHFPAESVAERVKEMVKESKKNISFDSQQIGNTLLPEANVVNSSVEQTLEKSLLGSGLTYKKVSENSYIIVQASKLTAPTDSNKSKKKTISGRVVDGKGIPVIGANILVKGTTQGVITDVDGSFEIKANEGSNLIVSFIGYINKEIMATGQNNLNIVLEEDSKTLDEVVVIGYGTTKKTDLTGALSSVANDKIVATHYNSATEALYGQLPGVDIVSSGTKPGGGYNIMVRGQNTIIAEPGGDARTDMSNINPPLYVVDGMYVTSINDISPNDIERIDVLKDASSTSIYGSRGANGVIIVTTKKGTEGRNHVEYTGAFSINSAMNLPDFCNADEYVQYRLDRAIGNNYSDNTYVPDLKTVLGAQQYDNYTAGKTIDWPSEILNTSYSQSHSLRVEGSGKGLGYSLGLGYNNEKGIIEGDSYTRYNVSASVNRQINDIFKIGANIYTAYEITPNASPETLRTAYRLNPLTDKYDTDGSLLLFSDKTLSNLVNPLLEMRNRTTETNSLHTFGNINLEIKPLKWLKYTITFTPDIQSTTYGSYIGSNTKTASGNPSGTSAQYRTSNTIKYTWDNILYGEKKWGDHSFNLTLGTSWYRYTYKYSAQAAKAFSTDKYKWYNMGAGTMTSMATSYEQEQLSSYFARINYDYKGRYLFTATGRTDGSSKLAMDHKWAFFPSAAIAWRVSEEDFLKDKNWLSNLKMRFSYGVSGNNGVDPYTSSQTVANSKYLFGNDNGVTSSSISNIENKTLSWELTKEFNLGLDFGFFNGRINGTIDVYNRRTNDIIMNRVMSEMNGFGSVTDNVGSINNRGIEISLSTVNIKTRDFSWITNINFTKNSNKIISLADGTTRDEANQWFVGKPVGVVWTYDQIGFWGKDEADKAAVYGLAPGSIKVRDIDNDGNTDNDDKVFKGSVFPKWTGGLTSTFAYKNFDLAFTVTTRQGQYSYSQFHRTYAMTDEKSFNVLKLNYWTPENTTGTWLRPGVNTGELDALFYQKTSYVKVGYINIGYNVPEKITRDIKLSKLRVYASCQNPFIFTGYKGWDPEMASTNTQSQYAMTRTFMFGINLGF